MLASVIPGHGWGQAAQLSQRPQASATPCTPTLPSPASPHPALPPLEQQTCLWMLSGFPHQAGPILHRCSRWRCGAMISVCLFLGAPGIISASPYAGAGFPPTFAIPQAAGIHTYLDPSDCMPTPMPTPPSTERCFTGPDWSPPVPGHGTPSWEGKGRRGSCVHRRPK
jgi:hypothetical protein